MSAAHIVRNISAETDSFNWIAGEVAGADKVVAELKDDLAGPGTLGISGGPERTEKPLCRLSVCQL